MKRSAKNCDHRGDGANAPLATARPSTDRTKPSAAIDETSITEITVQADGRVYVFGASRQVLEILEMLDPQSPRLGALLSRVRSLESNGDPA
ncbi:MAG TPA: hypothetical protein VFE47_07285 [Tepidisphaeraceae bacterium]|jgi:hypothetical protein|nr:hypothetical protein [Tepidisphaeraceae bacterium]